MNTVNEYFNCSFINRGHSNPVHSMLYWLEPMWSCIPNFSQLTVMSVFAMTALSDVVCFALNLLYTTTAPVVNPLWFPVCTLAFTPHLMLYSLRERSILSSCSMYKSKNASCSSLLNFGHTWYSISPWALQPVGTQVLFWTQQLMHGALLWIIFGATST